MRVNIRLGDLLVENGYITPEQLEKAIIIQSEDKSKRLGEILIERGFLREDQLLIALAKRLNLEVINLKSATIDLEVVELVPKVVSVKYCILPISKAGNRVTIAINDPLDFYAIEDVKSFIQEQCDLVLCKKEELMGLISKSYAELHARKAANIAGEKAQIITTTSNTQIIDGTGNGDESPVINLVNSILLKGYSEGTSDIHFEPFEDFLNIRFRIDGQLLEYMKLDIGLATQISTRIKILSELDIAERRASQDGNFKVNIGGLDISIRVSVIPTVFGEKIVIRFLSQVVTLDHADTYGMDPENYETMRRILRNPHGIVYITGPTGSGKTTTLYMAIDDMAKKPINISTIEDPVERFLPGIIQVQVNNKAGITFNSGLRSMLRQDPDVILVGETRDAETAQISVSAAITGHLVLSTLHTNDSISSIIRLTDMGIKPYLIANSVVGVVAQRLVKKICPLCKESYQPEEFEREIIGDDIPLLYRGVGCSSCNHSGYKGRIAIHEILEVDKPIRGMITRAEHSENIYNYVRENNKMIFMKDNIVKLIREGITTIEEYNKHTAFDL